ncbi:hypothetical protein Tco_0057644 [Tanacetum coccineum]
MWEAIKTHNLGADHVKEARLQTLITEFKNLRMLDNGTIDEYAAKLSGIASKSAALGEVMSEHKLVKKFLTSLPRCFVYIMVALEQVLDLKTTGFEDVIGRLKAYEERVKEEDKANDPQENFFMLGLNIPMGIMTQVKEEDVAHTLEIVDKVEVKDVVGTTRKTKFNVTPRKNYGQFVSKCPEQNQNHEVNLNETQEKGAYHEEGMFFMMNHIQETIFMNEEKYTPPMSKSNTDEDDVWYFDNGASNHMTGDYSHFSELNENFSGRVRYEDGSCVIIKEKGSILFQGKNREQKLFKDVYYIPALRCNVISLGQVTISGYDINIRDNFLTMRDSWGSLLIKVPRKTQLKVGKEDTNEVGQESGTFIVLCNDIHESTCSSP